MMNLRRVMAFLAAAIVLAAALTGCQGNQNMDDILAEVDGTPVYRWYYQLYHDKQLAYYLQYFGMDYTRKEYENEYQELKLGFLEDIVGRTAALNKALAEGYGELTAQEQADLDEEYAASYEAGVARYMEDYAGDANARNKAEEAYGKYLASMHLNEERLRRDIYENYVLQKFYQSTATFDEVTDEEIQARYDELMDQQKADAEAGKDYLGQRGYAINVYIPWDCVLADTLLIPYQEKDLSVVQAAEQAAGNAAMGLLSAVSEHGQDSRQAQSAQADMDKAMKAFQNAQEKAAKAVGATAQDALSRLRAGEEYGSVYQSVLPGKSQIQDYIFAESETVDAAVRDAALALSEPGSYSEIIRGTQGLVILRLTQTLSTGAVPLEQVRDQILGELQFNRYYPSQVAIINQCVEQAGEILRYTDKL